MEDKIPFPILLILMLIMAVAGGVYFSARRDEQGQLPWYATAGLIMFVCSLVLFCLAMWVYIRQYKVGQDVSLMQQWYLAAESMSKLTPLAAQIYCAVFLDGAAEKPSLPVGAETGMLVQGVWVNKFFAFRYLAPVRDGKELPVHERENRRQREAINAELAAHGIATRAAPGRAAVLLSKEQAVQHLRKLFG